MVVGSKCHKCCQAANTWADGYNAAVEAYKRSADTIASERARELSIKARNGDDEAAIELLREMSKTELDNV